MTSMIYDKKFTVVAVIVIAILLSVLMIFGPTIKEALTERETKYCQMYKNLTEHDELPRMECQVMKIYTKEMDKIPFEQFDMLKFDVSCVDDINELEKCPGESFFMASFPISLFCDGCDIDGVLCNAYGMEYLEDNQEYIDFLEEALAEQKFDNVNDLYDAIERCEE